MKKILIFICAVLVWPGCSGPKGFVINGTVDGPSKNVVYLFATRNGNTDVIATDTIVNGSFTLTGSVEGVELSSLKVDGVAGSLYLFIEDGAVFDVTLGGTRNVAGGGAAHKLDMKFADIHRESSARKASYGTKYTDALQSGDTGAAQKIKREFDIIDAETAAGELALIREYPDAYVSVYYATLATESMDLDKLKEKYAALGPKGRNFPTAIALRERIEAMEKVEPGQTAPDFSLTAPDGGAISLYGTDAKVRLIDFWASWCGPCRRENPHMVDLYGKFRDKGLEIIGVSLDSDAARWKQAIEEDGLPWLHGSELKGWDSDLVKIYVVSQVPYTILIDRDNKIIASGLRGDDLDEMLERLLM